MQRGWSKEQLALESGLARRHLGGVERGQRNIALLNICRLAEALNDAPMSRSLCGFCQISQNQRVEMTSPGTI
jgi:transcriptional regulator with XRE-family HTH domain